MNTDLFQIQAPERGHACPPRAPRRAAAFTLIEMLVVIAVIAILAALIFPVVGAVNKAKVRSRATAEVTRLEAAIEAYKVKMGFYPPSDTNSLVPNSLYYELVGTTYNAPVYTTTDQSSSMPAAEVPAKFGPRVGGFMNCTRGSGDEGIAAHKFLVSMKPEQYLEVTNPPSVVPFVALGTRAIDGPVILMSNEESPKKLNPWRYNSSKPVHNVGSFDLWIDVKIGNKVYRINNWGKEYVVTPPYNYWP